LRQIGRTIVERLLAWSARRVLAYEQPLVIGVTGSAGKTTTKEAIVHVLRNSVQDREVYASLGNLNTEFGLPLAILRLPKPEGRLEWLGVAVRALWRGVLASTRTSHPDRAPIVVLEYGIEQPGDMRKLVDLAPPNIAVVTNIGSAHTQFLGSLSAVAVEKGELVRSLSPQGIAILNTSDKLVRKMAERTRARVVHIETSSIDAPIQLALAVAEHGFGISRRDGVAALADWQRPKGRLQLLRGIHQTWLLDDSYNANPLSMKLALEEVARLAKAKKAKRVIAILGDMLELGREELEVHRDIAKLATKVTDEVILVGPRFRRSQLGSAWFPGPGPAGQYLLGEVRKGDMILVKGSQSMRMEKVSEVLLEGKEHAQDLLERQSAYWKQKPYVTP
ncbi:MAG: UDP-N-acetylmuramoyl-tripeptide--D-alanyl-D-alanine ligase, partial [Patescibacteria group bacterium]